MKVAFINMPFANIQRPSLGLSQLEAVVSQSVVEKIDVYYFNHEFCKLIGTDMFDFISNQFTSGLGDWLFRHIAFPEQPDNKTQYLNRFYPQNDPQTLAFKKGLLQFREQIDAKLDELINDNGLDNYDIVGFSSMFSQNGASFALAKKLKQRRSSICVVIGGANCESPMGEEIAKNVPQIDFVFSGPSLVSFPEFLKHYAERNLQSCNAIQGVLSKNNVDFLTKQNRIGKERPLDDYLPLDYTDFIRQFDEAFPKIKDSKLILFETSRGCWWGERAHCTFCGLNSQSMAYKTMAPEVAIGQFDDIFKYSGKCKNFSSVDNIIPQKYTHNVFPHINPPDNVNIFYEVKASLKEWEMELLSKSRVKLLQPGIEALDSSTLKLMKKGTSSFTNISFLKNCVLYDILPIWNLLIGFPGEQEHVFIKYANDLPLLSHLPPPGGCYPVRFDRYSPYFMNSKEYDLWLKPFDFYEYLYPFDKNTLNNMAYYFYDRNYASPYINMMSRWISKLNAIVARWNDSWKKANLDKSVTNELHQYQPELYFVDQNTIYDSRNGEIKSYEISAETRELLNYLDKPRSHDCLIDKFSKELSLESELEFLRSNGLVFKDENRLINLVLPRKGSDLAVLMVSAKESQVA